jgi:hypothetical protein
LQDCLRPQQRIYRMGEDILFDLELRGDPATAPSDSRDAHAPLRAAIQRIL